MKKIIILTVLVALAAISSAQYSSPELMFVADRGDSTHQKKIDRYDPISHQYLGSFGQGLLTTGGAQGMCVMGRSLYYLATDFGSNSTAIVGFNFSTGALTYSHSLSGSRLGLAASNGKLYASGGSGLIDVIDVATNVSSSFSSGFGDIDISGISASGTSLAFLGRQSGFLPDLKVYNLDSMGNIGGLRFRVAPSANITSLGSATSFSANNSGGEDVIVGGQASVFGGLNKYSGVTGGLLDTSTNVAGGSIWINNSTLATGHNGATYYMRTNNTVAVLNSNLPYSFSGNGGLGIPLTNTFSGNMVAVYAAPEPQPFILLALGACGFVIRRRKSNK